MSARRWLPVVGVLVVVLVALRPAWLEPRAFGYDARWQYWGDLQFQVDAIADGELPLWNPYDRLGYPFHADPQAGTLYPGQWPLVGLGLLLDTPWWLISVKVFAHLALGALGMIVLARRRALPWSAAALGALIWFVSYPILHNAASALTWGIAWVPWWLAAIDAWAARPTWRRACALGAAAAACALTGAWAAFWYGLLAVGPLALVEVVSVARVHPARRRYLVEVAATGALALAVFGVLAGAQIASTLGILDDTVRELRNASFWGSSAMQRRDLAGLFVPTAPGLGTYLGVIPVVLALAIVFVRPSARRVTLLVLTVGFVALAMGSRGEVLPVLADLASPFELWRHAHRYLFGALVPFGILAAEGFAALVSVEDRATRRKLAWVALGLGAGLAALALLAHQSAAPRTWELPFVRAALVAGAGGLGVWLWLRGPRSRIVPAIVVCAIGLDLWRAHRFEVKDLFREHTGRREPIPTGRYDAAIAGLTDVPWPHRIYDRQRLGFRPGLRLGLRDLGGYEDDPLALQRYTRVLRSVHVTPRVAAHAGVAYLFDGRKPSIVRPSDPALLPRPDLDERAFEVQRPSPAVVWHDAAEVVGDAGAAWRRTSSAAAGTRAVLEAPQLDAAARARAQRVDLPDAPPVAGRVVAWSRNRVVAEVTAPADGVVVVVELWHRSGWQATVDGEPAPIWAANGFARAVPVSAGPHRIEFTYHAPGYLGGATLALFGWLVLAGVAVHAVRRRR